jgi:uncharacterized membrane protein
MGLDSNLGAMLCYIANFICCLGLVLAIVFLFTEKENRFVKFHAVQSLFLVALQFVAIIIIQVLGVIVGFVLGMIKLGFLAGLLSWGFSILVFAVFIVFWVIGGIKAYSGQWYKLPIIGDLAWKSANR